MRTASLTAPNTCPALGEGAGMSMLTLESQLGRHDCSCLRSQRKRPPFGVICTQAKMCIELIGWDAEEPASARRGLSHCQFETSCTSAPQNAAAPTVTGRARGWAVLAAELPVACRQRAEPVVTDGCAHPKPWAKGDGTTPRRRRHLLSTAWPWRAREDVRRRCRAAV